MGVKIIHYDCMTVNLSLYVHQYLAHIFRCSSVRCINIYRSYILLVNCSFYQFVVFFCVSY